MTLSEFVQILNKHLGYLIEKDEKTKRKSNTLILRGFLLNFVSPDAPEDSNVQDFHPLDQSSDFLSKVYNGSAQLPYDDANSILNRLDAGAFSDFVKLRPAEKTLKALKADLRKYGKKLNIDDYEYDLMLILKEILIDIVENDEFSRLKDYAANNLLNEVNFECPLKKNHPKTIKLIKTRKKQIIGKSNLIPNYMILRIYPSGLTKEQKSQFDAIKKEPSKIDDDSNQICVCNDCYKKYMLNPTIDDYKYILSVKKNLATAKTTSTIISSVHIEEQINDILKALCNLDSSNIDIELRMKPLEIANKILPENIDLNKLIQNNLPYYYPIQRMLSSLDEKKATFKIIADQVTLCFDKLSVFNDEQNYVFYSLVDWILEQSGFDKAIYRLAAEKIVSFFVQDCEVFHEISK